MMDYSNFGSAPTEQGGSGELIPDGTLAWAIVKVRPFNLDQGMVLTPSKSTDGNAYLDLELTILDGPHARRKVWDIVMLKGSEKAVMMGMAKVRHILEIGREIVGYAPTDPKYRLTGGEGDMVLMSLDEMRCAIKIGVEKGQDSYPDKNKVRAYLSPNPASDTHKAFERLVAGDTAPPAAPAKAATGSPAAAPAWASKPGAASDARPVSPPAGRPAWAGGAPTQKSADEKIPF